MWMEKAEKASPQAHLSYNSDGIIFLLVAWICCFSVEEKQLLDVVFLCKCLSVDKKNAIKIVGKMCLSCCFCFLDYTKTALPVLLKLNWRSDDHQPLHFWGGGKGAYHPCKVHQKGI